MSDLSKENTNESLNENTLKAETVEEEVVQEVIPSMDEFADILNQSFKRIHVSDILTCTVITVTENELLVNMGYISDGIIPVEETFATEENKLQDIYHEGDVLRAEVIKINDGDGNVLLSVKKAESILVYEELGAAFENKTKLTVKVKEVVKGGVVCEIKGIRAFIPASLLSTHYVENLNDYVGRSLEVIVSDFNKDTSKVVLNRKAVEQEENNELKKNRMFSLKKGEVVTGKVVKLMNFGAFVDLGGVQGLIHNQDLSWSRVKHPSEIVSEGVTVKVTILDIDQKNEKISLGLKDLNADPWLDQEKSLVIGGIYNGQIEKITTYGAFVKLENGAEGLVHISEMCEKRIARPEEVVKLGEPVKVKVLDIDQKDKRIKLSMKNTEDQFNEEELDQYSSTENATTSLEDIFKVFLKDIEKK